MKKSMFTSRGALTSLLPLILLAVVAIIFRQQIRPESGQLGSEPSTAHGKAASHSSDETGSFATAVDGESGPAADPTRRMEPARPPVRQFVARHEKTISSPVPPDFLKQILSADEKTASIPLPGGGTAKGTVTHIQRDDKGLLLVQGNVTEPEAGKFMFQRQTAPGVAGSMVGHIHYDKSDVAYQVRPTGENGSPMLVKTTVDAVICRALPHFGDVADSPEQAPETHPTNYPVPPGENGIVQLESLPGATAVVYLDFDGEEENFLSWGYINALPSGSNTAQIFDVWKGIAEDYQPFNINITTVRSVYDAAPEGRRMHVIFTPTTDAAPGAGGVAYVGSFNQTGHRVCWVFYTAGKSAVEAGSHEIGHTVGLYHDGRTSPVEGYYTGHNGWAPIMGVGYYQTVSQWSKGEYPNANNTEDDLNIIVSNNNNVDYRTDDYGATHATSAWLDVASGGVVSNEGIIETTGDQDAFRFSTSGGNLSLNINNVGYNPNLDVKAEIVTSAGAVISTSDSTASTDASFSSLNLAAGDYFLRVTGVGKGEADLSTGYTNYGSLGAYRISGTVNGGVTADKFSITENAAVGSAVGTSAPRVSHGAGVPAYAISSGNASGAFTINPASGAITVANSSALDFETLSSRWYDPASFELFVSITDSLGVATESIRTVVTVTDANEPPVLAALGSRSLPDGQAVGTLVATANATEPDRSDYVSYSIVGGNTGGAFTINSTTGAITLVGVLDLETTPGYLLMIRATDTGGLSVDATLNVTVTPANPAADSDGDGFSDGLEFALGTDYQSAGSQPSSIFSSLRAWWKLDDAGGTLADDTTGRPQDGTVNGGAAWSTGKVGGAIAFDGVNDGVLVGTSAALTGTTDFTLSAWVKVAPASSGGVIIQQRDATANGYNGQYMLAVKPAGTVQFYVYNGSYQFDITTTATVNDGQWHRITATRSGTTGTIHIDTTQAVTGSGAVKSLATLGVAIGYDSRDSISYFNGSIDDVRIYSRALSAVEIGMLTNNTAPVFTFDPITGSGATEDSAYVGTLVGSATDADVGATLSYSKTTGPAWLSIAANGALSGTPGNADPGVNSFTVRVTDNGGLVDFATLNITVANVSDAPVFTSNPINGGSTPASSAFAGSIAGSATDPDPGEALAYSKISGPGWLSVASNGALTGTPAIANIGTNVFVVRVTDSGGLFTDATLNVTVTPANPAADSDGDGFTDGLEFALGTNYQSAGSQPPPIYSNLRAWWRLDETSGTLADDTTGRAQDGAVNGGAAWSTGRDGGALAFDGVNDGVLVGTSAALTGNTNFTLSAWVKVAPASSGGVIIQQRDNTATGYDGEYMLTVKSDGTVEFFIYNGGYQFDITTTATVNDGQWHRVTATRSGTSGTIHIDGTQTATGSGAIKSLVSLGVAIGYDYRDSISYFNGSIDDVRVYSRALSAVEISSLGSNVAPVFTADPILGSGATQDSLYTGTLFGSATDADVGDTLSYSKINGPTWLSIAANGTLSGTPANGDVGANSFSVRVTDSSGAVDSATLNIEVANVNDAPVFTSNPIIMTGALANVSYTGQTLAGPGSDPDAGDTVTFSKINGGPAWLTVAADGTLGGTPLPADLGLNSFTVRITDLAGLFADATLEIVVRSNVKADNTDLLGLGSSWVGGFAPTLNDTGTWTGAYNTAGSLAAALPGSALTWKGISLENLTGTAAGLVSIGGTGNATASSSLTIGNNGIDMSAANQNLVINSATTVLGASQTWNVASGRNLRFGVSGTGSANANIDGSGTITVSGGGLVDLNQGSGSGAGLAGFSGKWIVNSGTTLRGIRNFGDAFGSNTAADAITLSGGTLAVGGISGSQGTWSWNTNITLANATTSSIDQQIFSGTGRSLKLNGAMTGSGDLLFKESGSNNSFDSDDFGYIVTGTNTMNGMVTICGATENGIAGRLSSVRLGGAGGVSTATGAGTGGDLGTATVVNNGVLTLSRSNTWIFANAMSGTGKLRVSGGSTQDVTVSGNNSYSGGTDIASGILRVSTNNTALGSNALNFTGNATLATASGGGARSLANGVTVASTFTATLDATHANLTLGGIISGAGNLATTGSGIIILGGNNSYGGTTSVGGNSTLRVNGIQTGSGAVSVAATASLEGSGTLPGAVSLSGTLAPGDGVGTLSTGAVTMANASQIAWQAADWTGSAGTGYDKLVASSLNLTGVTTTVTVVLSGQSLTNFTDVAKTFTLVQTTGGITGFAANKFTIDKTALPTAPGTWAVQQNGNNLELAYTPGNSAPSISGPINGGNAAATAAYTGSIASSGSDPNPGDTLTFSKTSAPSWLNVASNGALSGTPGLGDGGTNNFTVRVTDGGGLYAETTLTITVTLTPTQTWQVAEFGADAGNPLIAGDDADPDGDGLKNLLEYALATNPNTGNTSGVIHDMTSVSGTNYLRLTVNKNPAATDLTFAVETCSDFTDWSSATTVVETNTANQLIARDTLTGDRRFIRLKVTR